MKRKLRDIIPMSYSAYGLTIFKWALIGLTIRIIITPLIVTNYDLLTIVESSLILRDRFQLIPTAYPAPILYLFASVYTLLSPVLPKTVFTNAQTYMGFTPPSLSLKFVLSNPNLLTYLVIPKSVYLVFDFSLAILLLHIIKDPNKGLTAFKVWMLNPVVLYVSYAVGQFDIIPVFLFTLALYSMQSKKTKTAALLLGIAGALKSFALIFALPFAIVAAKGLKGTRAKIKTTALLLLISLAPVIFSLGLSRLTPPYYESANMAAYPLELNGFFGKTLYNRGTTGQPFLIGISTFLLDYSLGFKTLATFYDVIYLFVVIYILFLLLLIYQRDLTFKQLGEFVVMILLVYYAVSLFHPQWFLWIQPLLILLVLEDVKKFFKVVLLLIPLYFIYILYWQPNILAVIDKTGFPGYQVVNVLRSVFSALCLFIAFLILRSQGTLRTLFRRE